MASGRLVQQKCGITTEADGALLHIFFSVLVLFPLDLGELVRERVPLDAVLGRAAVVVPDGATLLDDAQVVVVTSGPSGLKKERVHDTALEIVKEIKADQKKRHWVSFPSPSIRSYIHVCLTDSAGRIFL